MSNAESKSLFIIKGRADHLALAETWLRGKNWRIESTTDLRAALTNIVQFKPDFVIVCMDHPSPKIRALPRLFEQAFQLRVIVYLQQTTPSSLALISGFEYCLFPPVSGTAIDRMCSKVERDQRRRLDVNNQRTQSAKTSLGTTDTGVISIKGEGNLRPGHVNLQEQAQKVLAQLLNSAAKSDIEASGQLSSESSYKIGVAAAPETPKPLGPRSVHTGQNAKSNASLTNQSGSSEKVGSTSTKSAVEAQAAVDSIAKERAKEAAESLAASIQAAQKRAKRSTYPYLKYFIDEKSPLNADSPIVQSTHEAIQATAKPQAGISSLQLEKTQQMLCLSVGSSRQHGYMLCAMAKDMDPAIAFTEEFRKNLTQNMLQSDKNFVASDPIEIHLQPVQFENWCLAQAQFLKKFTHLNRECAIGYFIETMPTPEPARSHPTKMLSISLQELSPGRMLEFDIFLHLPENQRFVRYARKGRYISEKQKAKLEQRHVKDIFLKEGSQVDLYRYRLQRYLDQKITDHLETVASLDSAAS